MLLPQLEVDILLTDDAMSDRKLLIILPLIKEQYPELKIIVNSMTSATNEEPIKIIKLADR